MVIAERGGGALYVLFLKRHLDANARLQRDDYVEIVEDTQETLIRGIQRNLRRPRAAQFPRERVPARFEHF